MPEPLPAFRFPLLSFAPCGRPADGILKQLRRFSVPVEPEHAEQMPLVHTSTGDFNLIIYL